MSANARTCSCPAKVNLALSVGSPRSDGYHPIASWMLALDFADALSLRPLPAGETSRFNIHFTPQAPRPQAVDWPLEKDLTFRVHQLAQQQAGRDLPVDMQLAKVIPAGAGLAGGSANAAAMLVGLNEVFSLQWDLATLRSLASQLGSDIVFLVEAMYRRPSAIVSGVGEQIQPLDAAAVRNLALVLVFPPFGCSTADVYGMFDQQYADELREPDLARVRRLAETSPLQPQEIFNDLAEPACRVAPPLAKLRHQLAESTGRTVHVSGSGSTLFFVAQNHNDAQTLSATLRKQMQLPTVATGVFEAT